MPRETAVQTVPNLCTSSYDFSPFPWCESDTHSVETIL